MDTLTNTPTDTTGSPSRIPLKGLTPNDALTSAPSGSPPRFWELEVTAEGNQPTLSKLFSPPSSLHALDTTEELPIPTSTGKLRQP